MAKKNLGNAEQVSSMASSDNYLIETGGSIRRVANANVPAVYDSDGNVIVDTYKRLDTCIASNWRSGSSGWLKFATYNTALTTGIYCISHFHVTMYRSTAIYSGALNVRLGRSSAGNYLAALTWETLISGFDIENLIVAYSPDEGIFELWIKLDNSYYNAVISKIQANTRDAVAVNDWIMIDTSTIEEAPTEGYTQVVGTLATLQNPVSTTSLSDIQTLEGGGISDSDTLLIKTENGLQGITIAQLRDLLKE